MTSLPNSAPPEEIVAEFLEHAGTGRIDRVRAMLAQMPTLVNAIGPHPFWGGRPQALHVAVEAKRHDIANVLLDAGADLNGANGDYDHWSPLMLAINRHDDGLRDALLARGARVGLLEALLLGDDARVDAYLREDGLPEITPNGGSILAFARTPWAVDRLLALGAPTDMKDRWGSTPIDAASRLGPPGQPLVRHFLSRGIVAAPKEYARLGDIAQIGRLVEADPAVATLDSVMMGAVDFAHHDLVIWLLAHGANVNAKSDAASRHSALHSAAWNGDLKMVRLLVDAGADVHARDNQYRGTPRQWAATSIDISNNPRCADVVAYFDSRPS